MGLLCFQPMKRSVYPSLYYFKSNVKAILLRRSFPHCNQLVNYAKACVKPAYDYFNREDLELEVLLSVHGSSVQQRLLSYYQQEVTLTSLLPNKTWITQVLNFGCSWGCFPHSGHNCGRDMWMTSHIGQKHAKMLLLVQPCFFYIIEQL